MPRAPRGGSWAAEYAARIARFEREHPGASRSAARGHATGAGEVAALLRQIASLPPGSQIAFTGTDRQPDGTWRTARFDLFFSDAPLDVPEHAGGSPPDPPAFNVGPEQLYRLKDIRDAIAATGIAVLGADYLEKMVQWVDEQPPPPTFAIQSPRTGRYLSGVSKKGNALTKKDPAGALTSPNRRKLSRYLSTHAPQLRARGYRIVTL